MDLVTAKKLVESRPHWHHRYEIFPGVVVPGNYDPRFMLEKLNLPSSLKGKKVLDIGASDGFYSLHCHKLGADVTALDYRHKTTSGFATMEKISEVSIKHVVASVYDIGPELGQFDIVLFLGVIYHLPDIPASLWRARQVCAGKLYLESYVEDFGSDKPLARYYESDTLVGDSSNFWAPNVACMEAMLRDTGYSIEKTHAWGDRALIEANANQRPSKMEIAYGRKMPAP
jgi:tRNA (mo5U34)-methyltransferase